MEMQYKVVVWFTTIIKFWGKNSRYPLLWPNMIWFVTSKSGGGGRHEQRS